MEQTSQREIRAIDPTWSIAELMTHVVNALTSRGPVIAFSPVTSNQAPSPIALIVNTSGTTGQVKEVGLSAAALLTNAKSANNYLGAKPGEVWSLLLPITHIAGINILIRSLELGTIPLDLRDFEGKYPDADFTAVVPTQLYRALNGDNELMAHLLSAKAVLVGGSALSPELSLRAKGAGINVIETYGMTETCGGCVYDGNPINDTTIKITELGIITIASASMATTYLNDSELWNSKVKDNYFYTADLGVLESGKLQILGRADEIIITGGENISLSAVENLLLRTFTGIDCAAFSVKDPQWGESLYLAIAGEVKPEHSAMNEYLSSQISNAAKIKKFIYIPKLPRTDLGKIDRARLVQISLEN